jgi:hypothetical protein
MLEMPLSSDERNKCGNLKRNKIKCKISLQMFDKRKIKLNLSFTNCWSLKIPLIINLNRFIKRVK